MSIALQQSVLYGLLSYGEGAWIENSEYLHEGLFTGDNVEVFKVISKKHRQGILADFQTIAGELSCPDTLDSINLAFVGRATIPDYIAELHNAYVEARKKEIGKGLLKGDDRQAAIQALLELESKDRKDNVHDIAESMKTWMEDIQDGIENPDGGIMTGWRDVDRMLGGVRGGNLMILAARPSMGKTAAALNVAAAQSLPTLVFSLEMSRSEVMNRLMSGIARIDHSKLRNPKLLTEEDWPRISAGMERLSKKKILINDTGGISMNAIEAASIKANKAEPLGLIIIDYLQLVTMKSENRFQEVSEVSRRLKALAKNLDIPILALSQLNRASETKTAPTLADLRESGQIEQDADQVIFIQREEVVNPATANVNTGTFYIRKNRHGLIADVPLVWQGQFQRFVDPVQAATWGAK